LGSDCFLSPFVPNQNGMLITKFTLEQLRVAPFVRIFWNPKSSNPTNNISLQTAPVLSQVSPPQAIAPYFFQIPIILLSTPIFSCSLSVMKGTIFSIATRTMCRSQWPRGLRRRSSAARLLRLWIRIPLGALMFVCCECCVMLERGLCDRLITLPEESYRLWRVVVCDQETSITRRLKPARGL